MRKTFRLVCRVGNIRFADRATVSLGDIFDARTEDEAIELVNKGYAEFLSVREVKMNEEEIKKVIEEYATQEGFDDVLGIISDLIEERGDRLDYSIRSIK